jgi:hypothetical protein
LDGFTYDVSETLPAVSEEIGEAPKVGVNHVVLGRAD